jgi:hypothetical protein
MYLFSYNSKLKRDNIFKFSLPMGKTCPGAMDCLEYCYMIFIYRLRGDVCRNAHNRNFKLSKLPCFPAVAIHELKARQYIKRLRLHDSGDFYSQGYLNKWYKIAVACPEVLFYCYTKSLHLDFKRFKSLKNVKVIQSQGGKYKLDKRMAHAVVIAPGAKVPVGYVNGSRSDMVTIKHNRIYLYMKGGK